MLNEFHRKSIALVAIGLALIVIAIYGAIQSDKAHASPRTPTNATHMMTRPPLPWWMKRPCPTEDSYNCYWNDGGGFAFYARRMPHTGKVCIFYVDRERARISDQCYKP